VKIVSTFLSMAREQPPKRKLVDINRVIHDVVDLLDFNLRNQQVALELELTADLPGVLADHNQLHQVISNLVVNAQQALQDQPQKLIRILAKLLDDKQHICIKVMDSGTGIEPELRARIFEPFFTTKPVGVGTGLGLSVCNGIIQSHGGSIEYEEVPGMGACFVLRLPIANQDVDQSVSSSGEKIP
jgi:two-component system NtrC family sensor kinase